MYAKLIEGEIQFAPRKIVRVIDGRSYTTLNPTGEMLEEQGWLPVVKTQTPGDAPDGYHYIPTYSEVNGEIVQGWELLEIEYSEEEAFDILFGGDEP